ncbi:GPR1 FUN34 yaaH [Cordyceps militaris]|uniref:GPR1 FUN34 yaaH n=1 Tax=Cordyceps militaris TaxID=73501 RepID=A0A2H4SF64_CORMI|nr:GPR1 FUN34 yaaH [Cordyceps militaris]
MSAEATRLLTHRRTRFRSSTSSERGDVADVLDLAQHVYPTAATRPAAAAMPCTADKAEERELHPAGLVALGFALLFLGLHHWLCTGILLSSTVCGVAAAQLIASARGSAFARAFHGAHSLVWTATVLLQLAQRGSGRGSDRGRNLSVVASMLLMAAALACGAAAVAILVVRPLLAAVSLGLLCLSRAAFQRPHEAAAAATMEGYGGVLLVLASGLAFRAAWWARRRPSRVACVRQPL